MISCYRSANQKVDSPQIYYYILIRKFAKKLFPYCNYEYHDGFESLEFYDRKSVFE